MGDLHLTTTDIEQYVEKAIARARLGDLEQHLAACAICRARIEQERRMSIALRAMPRAQSPRELAARISVAVLARAAQEQARRARLPYIAIATLFSILLTLWFGLDVIVASQANNVFDFWELVTSYPDLFSADWLNALIALIEALPLTEMLLTACALFTVGVLAQQLVDSLSPRARELKSNHIF